MTQNYFERLFDGDNLVCIFGISITCRDDFEIIIPSIEPFLRKIWDKGKTTLTVGNRINTSFYVR